MDDKELLAAAEKAKEHSYSPYSSFRVGAALLTAEGKVFSGCNVENSSYGMSNCAERTAVFSAVAAGYKKFSAIAVTSDSEELTYPCGACRQVLVEFNPRMKVIIGNNKGDYIIKEAAELLPMYFSLAHTEEKNGL